MNTSIKQKEEFWPKFEAACKSQWMCGGDRYALSKDKEFTDLICEAVGNNFCASQILKQTGELTNINPKPEVGFFKIAVWAFIWWLKEQENLTDRDKGEEFDAGTPLKNPGPCTNAQLAALRREEEEGDTDVSSEPEQG